MFGRLYLPLGWCDVAKFSMQRYYFWAPVVATMAMLLSLSAWTVGFAMREPKPEVPCPGWRVAWTGRQNDLVFAQPFISATLTRMACFGWCPSYTVTVRHGGTLDYVGFSDVMVRGGVIAQLDEKRVTQLVTAFRQRGSSILTIATRAGQPIAPELA